MSEVKTIYGYSVEQLALIAEIMRKKNITPEEATDVYLNITEMVLFIVKEQHNIIKCVLEDLIR